MTSEKNEARSAGTNYENAKRQEWNEDVFKILSIDGGGIRGLLPILVLAEIEDKYLNGKLGGKLINDHFDMFVGTSTGGIIALALGHGKTAKEIAEFYINEGPNIFKNRWRRSWLSYFTCAYEQENLVKVLSNEFGSSLFGSIKQSMVIPTFEGKFGEPGILKQGHPRYKRDRNLKIVEVARATAAAPGYFRPFKKNGYSFVDGGIVANNPVMNGVAEALASYNIKPSQLRILTMGCGKEPAPIKGRHHRLGQIFWIGQYVKSSIASQMHDATGQARIIAGGNNLVRIDKEIKNLMKLDDVGRAINELPSIAKEIVKEITEGSKDKTNEDEILRIICS